MSHQPYPQQPGWGPQQPQQPGWGPPPAWGTPPPPPPKKSPIGKILGFGCLGILGLSFLIGAISALVSSDSGNTSKDNTSVAADDTAKDNDTETEAKQPTKTPEKTPGLSKREITKLSVNMVWDGYDETQRDGLCLGIDLNGPDWFADQLQSDNIDPDYAGELVADKCESRP